MRIATYEQEGKQSFGVVIGDAIVDLGRRIGDKYNGVLELLRAEALAEVAEVIADASADVKLDKVKLLRPVPFPEKIFCVGVNYTNRNAEYKDGSDAPEFPSIFVRTPDSLVGHGAQIVRP
ncbi:MAG TPA: 2-hydroxyhepta-2,4-diene-1,7-dioate isomerase, partial [Rhodospirillales bacterium]|nr:2-hydroxyhepta-2,4-diene-1,7-dioate isomerase [Rhodospirillales bacterium]